MNVPHSIIFMGTPAFAVTILEKLCASAYRPSLVITQQDKPIGRSHVLTRPPVKVCAQQYNIPVWQPESLRDARTIARFRELKPDCMVVAAYGKIIPKEILDIPRFGALNVHASLLPRWRGASPIQHALLAGDKETGASIMQIDEGLDTGPVLSTRATSIAHDETMQTLSQKLATLGADALLDILPQWFHKTVFPVPQDNAQATHAPFVKKSDGMVTEKHTAGDIERMLRALNPWPGVFLRIDRKILKILSARTAPCEKTLPPLSFSINNKKELCLHTADGCCALDAVQPEGKKPMSGYAFYIGRKTVYTHL